MTTTLTARSAADLVAAVPVVLGFVPADSVVLLTFGAREPFHARLDLPDPDDLEEVTEAVAVLLEPCRVHAVQRVAFVLFTDDAMAAASVGLALSAAFTRAGIDVIDVVRADGRRWYSVSFTSPGREEGEPYDLSAHRFAAQSVVDGRVTLGSRAELAASVAPDPARVAGVAEALAADGSVTDPGAGAGDDPGRLLLATASRLVATGERPSAADVALLVRAVDEPAGLDAAAGLLTRLSARDHVDLWTQVVVACPEERVATPAALLGLAAWLSGHGALAWCALDRCLAVEPEHGLGRGLAEALTRALPPSAWDDQGPAPAA